MSYLKGAMSPGSNIFKFKQNVMIDNQPIEFRTLGPGMLSNVMETNKPSAFDYAKKTGKLQNVHRKEDSRDDDEKEIREKKRRRR